MMIRTALALAVALVGGCATAPTCASLNCNCPGATTCDFSSQTNCVDTTSGCTYICGTASVCHSGVCGPNCNATCSAGSDCTFAAGDGSSLGCNHASCTLSGGNGSKADCTGHATCTITLGQAGTVTCDTSTSCGISVGGGSMVTCSAAASCDVTCSGVCNVDCTDATCTLHCAGAAARTVSGATGACP